MEKINQELANIQKISHALADMNGLTKGQRTQIASWISEAIVSGYRIAGQENGNEILQEATWNLTGF